MLFKTTGAVAIAAVMMVGGASAATISVFNDDDGVGQQSAGDLRGSITCSSCGVLNYTPGKLVDSNGAYGFGIAGDFGELFELPTSGNNPVDEATRVENILGLGTVFSSTVSDDDKTDPANDNSTYTSNAEYVALKIGAKPDFTVLKNLTNGVNGGIFTFSWAPESGAGAGLSHFTELGEVNPVPLPAAGWLMLAGVGGLAALRRRKTV